MLSLKLEGISKSFGSQVVLKNINLEVKTGQCCAVLGPNGSGKSTLLKIIARLTRPSAGRLILSEQEKEIAEENLPEKLFWIAPDFEFYGELTASENLDFFCRMRGKKLSATDSTEVVRRVGLREKENKPVGTYSSGMKQRLKFALALLCQPKILLLDEPSLNLDQDGVNLLDRLIKEAKPGTAIFLATNHAPEAKYADFSCQLG